MAHKKMKKTTKGVIAALLGLGLLGGYGTFALWSQSQSIQGNTITAGDFALTTVGTPAWTDVSPDGETGWTGTDPFEGEGTATPIDDMASFLMVPGDLLDYTATVHVVATGTNMQAELSIDTSQVEVPDDLADYIVYGVDVADADGDSVGSGNATDKVLVELDATDAAGEDYTVQIRVGFDGATPNTEGVTQAIDLSGMTFDLKQVRS